MVRLILEVWLESTAEYTAPMWFNCNTNEFTGTMIVDNYVDDNESITLDKMYLYILYTQTQIAKFMGLPWGPPGSRRPHMGPMLAPWTLLSWKGLLFYAISIKARPRKKHSAMEVITSGKRRSFSFHTSLSAFLLTTSLKWVNWFRRNYQSNSELMQGATA